MNKLTIVLGVFLATTGNAFAACSTPFLAGGALSTLLTSVGGRTICSPSSCTGSNCSWQEQHRSGGQLWDYKKGPSDAVDPSEQVGTWSISGNTVTHTYGAPPPYPYNVKDNGDGTFSFCGANGEFTFRVLSGQTGC
jgi:hypothetical protein